VCLQPPNARPRALLQMRVMPGYLPSLIGIIVSPFSMCGPNEN
jgi:hypothetical protein